MPSQLKSQSIKNPSEFTFCDIPKLINQEQTENDIPLGFSNCKGSSPLINTMFEGRKELMEMLNDLPESWYELSLKDMVVKDPDDSGLMIENKVALKPNLKGKKKGAKRDLISRSVSFDTGVFLLKMFVPSSFGSKKHKVSRSASIDGTTRHHVDVKQTKAWFFVEKKSKVSSRSYNNDRCTSATKNRYEEGTLKLGCLFGVIFRK
ncbi:hypothetical protein R6Q59_019594 [Mikania micrantha]